MPFFIENPADKYGNRAYTSGEIVEAEVSTDDLGREILHFITPEIKAKWSSVIRNSYNGWTEVNPKSSP